MAEPEDLEQRVSALEAEMRTLRERVQGSEQDAAAARVLAGGADRDVSEIRAEIRDFRGQNARMMNAMREDLADQRTDLTTLRAEMQAGFTEVRGRLDATSAGQEQIARMLQRLIDQSEG